MGLSITMHPILGAFACVFAGLAILADLRRYAFRDLVVMALATIMVAAPWIAYIALSSSIECDGIPNNIYLFLTRTLGNHWFPAHLGVYSDRHWNSLVPFLSFCLLLVLYLFDAEGRLSIYIAKWQSAFAGCCCLFRPAC